MKKFYLIALGLFVGSVAVTARAESPVNITYSDNQSVSGIEFYDNTANALDASQYVSYADGHMHVTMVQLENNSYRADIWYNRKSNPDSKQTIDPLENQYIAIKFIGDKPAGSLKLEWLGENISTKSNWTPTGNLTTYKGNKIYYWNLSSVYKKATGEDGNETGEYLTPTLVRYHFTIADCTSEPYEYTVDWIRAFSSLDELTAATNWYDDGDAEQDDLAPIVLSRKVTTTDDSGESTVQWVDENYYSSLEDVWALLPDAGSEAVITLKESQSISGGRLEGGGRTITLKGEGEGIAISRSGNKNQLMFRAAKSGDYGSILTFENLTIDGSGVTNAAIEAANLSGSTTITLSNVKFVNFSGVNYAVNARRFVKVIGGVTEENCSFNNGAINSTDANDYVTFSGSNTISINVGKEKFFKASDVTGGLITINNVSGETRTQATMVQGSTAKEYFALGTGFDGKQLVVSGKDLVLADTPAIPTAYVIKDGEQVQFTEDMTSYAQMDPSGSLTVYFTNPDGCDVYYRVINSVQAVTGDAEGVAFAKLDAESVVVSDGQILEYYAQNTTTGAVSKTMSVALHIPTGVENVIADGVDAAAPVEYYNLQGVRVANPANGIYLRKQGAKVSKIYVK